MISGADGSSTSFNSTSFIFIYHSRISREESDSIFWSQLQLWFQYFENVKFFSFFLQDGLAYFINYINGWESKHVCSKILIDPEIH